MRDYYSIPEDIKPSPAAAKLHYAGAFDNDFAFSLRERKSATLAAMFTDSLEVEANMMASGKMKHRDVDRRRKEENVPSPSSSASDVKFDIMLKTMEKLMDKLTMDARPFNREQGDPQIRNPNFRRPNPPVPPQNRQRDQRNPRNQEEQPIRPPFPENYVGDEEDPPENEIHLFGEQDSEIYLTKEEHNMFAQEDANEEFKNESYQRGYLHAMDDVQRKMKLRNRDVPINKGKANPNQPSSSSLNVEKGKETQQEPFVSREV